MFHGVGDACIYPLDIDMINVVREGTGAYIECVEIGLPTIGSIFTSMDKLAAASCEKVS